MLFAHDTTAALVLAADLVNTGFPDVAALESFLDQHAMGPRPPATEADLRDVDTLRARLRQIWETTSTDRLAALINDLLYDSGARPYLFDHDGWGWHLHFSRPDALVPERLAAQAAFALADLVRLGGTARLRRCEAPGCEAVFTDLSKNQSRRYCDTGNCGNCQHVAAYRARRARASREAASSPSGGPDGEDAR